MHPVTASQFTPTGCFARVNGGGPRNKSPAKSPGQTGQSAGFFWKPLSGLSERQDDNTGCWAAEIKGKVIYDIITQETLEQEIH